MAARAYSALRAPAPLNVAVAAMAAFTELGRPDEALEIFQERLKGKEMADYLWLFQSLLFDRMVSLCKVTWSFWRCWKMMENVWWRCFWQQFFGQTFQDDVCQELRDSGALALKGQSLELLDSELAKSKVLIAVRQKIWTTYQDEDCRDAQEHGAFFLLEIEDMQTHTRTHTHSQRQNKNTSITGCKK